MKEDLDRALDEVVIDVTIPLQSLVMDSKILIPSGRAKVSSPFTGI